MFMSFLAHVHMRAHPQTAAAGGVE